MCALFGLLDKHFSPNKEVQLSTFYLPVKTTCLHEMKSLKVSKKSFTLKIIRAQSLFHLLLLYFRVKLPWTKAFAALPTICVSYMVCIFFMSIKEFFLCLVRFVRSLIFCHIMIFVSCVDLQVSGLQLPYFVPLHANNALSSNLSFSSTSFSIRIHDNHSM